MSNRPIEALGVAIGEVGISVEDYNSGAMILFKGGGYDGFNVAEIRAHLTVLGQVAARFPAFTNVMRLNDDYRRGRYAEALAQADDLARARGL